MFVVSGLTILVLQAGGVCKLSLGDGDPAVLCMGTSLKDLPLHLSHKIEAYSAYVDT